MYHNNWVFFKHNIICKGLLKTIINHFTRKHVSANKYHGSYNKILLINLKMMSKDNKSLRSTR